MPNAKLARGRPKGTGLDDRAIIQSVIEMVAANPDLKPTTAIRSFGVTDPSAIRRLRDKFHAVHGSPSSAPALHKRAPITIEPPQPARAVALKSISEPVRSAAVQVKSQPAKKQQQAVPAASIATTVVVPSQIAAQSALTPKLTHTVYPAAAPSWLSLWAELSMQTMAASIDAQWMIYDQVLRSPPVTAAFESHAVLTEFAAAWCANGPPASRSVH
jgi:hypothetical protein